MLGDNLWLDGVLCWPRFHASRGVRRVAYEGGTFTRPNSPGQWNGECHDRAHVASVQSLLKGKSIEDGAVAAGTIYRIYA